MTYPIEGYSLTSKRFTSSQFLKLHSTDHFKNILLRNTLVNYSLVFPITMDDAVNKHKLPEEWLTCFNYEHFIGGRSNTMSIYKDRVTDQLYSYRLYRKDKLTVTVIGYELRSHSVYDHNKGRYVPAVWFEAKHYIDVELP